MKKQAVKVFTIMAAVLFLSITVMELNSEARVGGSRSMGSRGSRNYSRPASTATQPSQSAPLAASTPGGFQQPAGGGFMRGMAGGMMGGMLGSMLGSMLFSGSAGAAGGTAGGGGIGMFEIILLAGGGYLLYRYMKKKRAESSSDQYRR